MKQTRQAWIVQWLKENFCADSVNQQFHEDYHKTFPKYKQAFKFWGAQPVARAMQDLAEMERDGLLKRGRVSLGGNWQPGFPKWVWSYTLNK